MPNFPAPPTYQPYIKCKELHEMYSQCLLDNNQNKKKCKGEYVLYLTCNELCTDYPHYCYQYINKIKKLYKSP